MGRLRDERMTANEYQDLALRTATNIDDPNKLLLNGILGLSGETGECADIIIRVFDASGKYGIDIGKAILQKHEYNKSRPYRHGGKKL